MTQGDSPQLDVAPAGAAIASAPGTWRMAFDVRNAGGDDVTLLEARMPHVVLRAEAQALSGEPALASGASVRLEFDVAYQPREDASEPANPFLILRVSWRGAQWRVLTQLALGHGVDGAPVTQTAVVTAHRVGFSEV